MGIHSQLTAIHENRKVHRIHAGEQVHQAAKYPGRRDPDRALPATRENNANCTGGHTDRDTTGVDGTVLPNHRGALREDAGTFLLVAIPLPQPKSSP